MFNKPLLVKGLFLISALLPTNQVRASDAPHPDDPYPGGGFPREEMEEMMRRWVKGQEGDLSELAYEFYTDDAEYSFNLGQYSEMRVRGPDQIAKAPLGYWVEGFEDWEYPYYDIIIDDKNGRVVAFYRHLAPGRRKDGTRYELSGLSGSVFTYAGKFAT